MCDIRRLGGEIAEQLALVSPNSEAFRFDASSVPPLPPTATSDQVVITRAHHDYNGCWRADSLQLHATRQTLQAFGVVVLASLFAAPDHTTEIALTHPATDIRTLRIKSPRRQGHPVVRAALWYDYRLQEPHKFPWADAGIEPNDLPAVHLTDRDELGGITDAQWLARDTVTGFGTQEGVARFGQLLIDIGHPANAGNEYRLEGEAGVRGVAPLSAELNIWLPGSVGWDPSRGLT